MEWVVSIVVALIAGCCSIVGAIIASVTTRNAVLSKLETQQAVQNERIDMYQRVTNEKIDRLYAQTASQAEYGSRLVILEDHQKRTDEAIKKIEEALKK